MTAKSESRNETWVSNPIDRAIALLETFAESGMEAVDADSRPTPNARYCLECAADLRALRSERATTVPAAVLEAAEWYSPPGMARGSFPSKVEQMADFIKQLANPTETGDKL